MNVLARPHSDDLERGDHALEQHGDDLENLIETLARLPGIAAKRDIAASLDVLGRQPHAQVPNGDDTAVIPLERGFQLLAIEGFIDRFVARSPWFAGYCGVMVNVSDIHAMGGRPLAIVDALWSADDRVTAALLDGLRQAADVYGIPIVGGHTNRHNATSQLAVAILGHAERLLSSFAARPGQRLLAVTDLRGRYEAPFDYWNASVGAPAARLRGDLALLPALAELGWCAAAKDISQAGPLGTALMLLECSGLGATLEPHALPRPGGVSLTRWLATFPSYGFILSVDPVRVKSVIAHFRRRDLDIAEFGTTDASGVVRLSDGRERREWWDLRRTPLMGCGPFSASRESVPDHSTGDC